MAVGPELHLRSLGREEPETTAVRAVGVTHRYDAHTTPVSGVDLAVGAGEFCTLLGPSGSGKTTLLRIFAGLLRPTEGRVLLSGRDVTDEPVQRREVGFVFQNYALFPHLTVGDNIGFALRLRKWSRAARRKRVEEILELISLEGAGGRHPGQLSGGEQQRVAVGRALAFNPKVLLLDEPLGALDRRLRQGLGSDLRRIQQETSTTAVYVTHDQEEAFLLSDVVVVMEQGRVHQVGAPDVVYGNPMNLFVAKFLGDTNVIQGVVVDGTESIAVVDLDGIRARSAAPRMLEAGSHVSCSVRPEAIEIYAVSDADRIPSDRCVYGRGVIERSTFMGARRRTMIAVNGKRLLADVENGEYAAVGHEVIVAWRDGAPTAIA